ncbi:MAG: alanine racemase [Bacilli bacterium]|nr:alanine racemase [Bacilli bacterium]
MMYRNTYAKVNLENIKKNVKTIINNYSGYKYYIGVVKADTYGHNSNKVIKSIIDGGCNYLAVSSLEEALEIRKDFSTPIICLGIIDSKYIDICINNNIDITIPNINYFNEIKTKKVNAHIKIDTGMNRLGIKEKSEFNKIFNTNTNINIKGIYTHIYETTNYENTLRQISKFKEITNDIDLNKIDMIHIAQSDTLINYPKIDFCNGCRLGIIMYGLTDNNLELSSTIELISEIIDIKKLKKGETVSYNGTYKASENELIGIVSIGYADGINRKLKNAYIYINDKKYKIVGNICMDMLMVKIDDSVKLHDKVYVYKDINHIKYLSNYLDTIPYELICNISKRVPRIYI